VQGQFVPVGIRNGMAAVDASFKQIIAPVVIMSIYTAEVRADMVDGTAVAFLEGTVSLNISPDFNHLVI